MMHPALAPTLLTTALLMQPALVLPAASGPLISPAMQLLLTGLLTAAVLYATNWLTQRNLRTSLENIRLNAEIVAKELEASKEADKVQAEKVTKIEDLVVTTHTIVNSQKSEMKADMATQKVELEKVIAQLRADLRLAESVGVQQAPAMQAGGGASSQLVATIPAVTVPVVEGTPDKSRIITPAEAALSRTPQG